MNTSPTRSRSAAARLTTGIATVALLATAAPANAAPDYTINVAKTPRGAAAAVPLIDSKTLRDGDVKIKIPGDVVWLLGSSANAYFVGTMNDRGGNARLWRYAPDGSRTLLLRNRAAFNAVLSDDGSTAAFALVGSTTRIATIDTASGAPLAIRRVAGGTAVLDIDKNRVAVSRWNRAGTFIWHTDTDKWRRISRLVGYDADLAGDRFAAYTGDPYDGGCSVVAKISNAQKRFWRSCDDRVAEFDQGGKKMATIDLLSDGLGPNRATLRGSHGRTKATFNVGGWFGGMDFEPGGALLLETTGRKKAATVRATPAGVERVTRLRKSVWP